MTPHAMLQPHPPGEAARREELDREPRTSFPVLHELESSPRKKKLFAGMRLASRRTSLSLSHSPAPTSTGEPRRRFSFLSSTPLLLSSPHPERPYDAHPPTTPSKATFSASLSSTIRKVASFVRLPTSPGQRRALRTARTTEPATSVASSSVPDSSAGASFTSTFFHFARRPSTDSSSTSDDGLRPFPTRAPHEWRVAPTDQQRQSLDAYLFPSPSRRQPALFRSSSSGELRGLDDSGESASSRPYSPSFPFPRAPAPTSELSTAPLHPSLAPRPSPAPVATVRKARSQIQRLPSDVMRSFGGAPSLPCLKIQQLGRKSSLAPSIASSLSLPSPKSFLYHRASISTISSTAPPLDLDIRVHRPDGLGRPHLVSRFSDDTPSDTGTPTSFLGSSLEDFDRVTSPLADTTTGAEEDLESTASQEPVTISERKDSIASEHDVAATFGRASTTRSSMEETERWIDGLLEEQAAMLKVLEVQP